MRRAADTEAGAEAEAEAEEKAEADASCDANVSAQAAAFHSLSAERIELSRRAPATDRSSRRAQCLKAATSSLLRSHSLCRLRPTARPRSLSAQTRLCSASANW